MSYAQTQAVSVREPNRFATSQSEIAMMLSYRRAHGSAGEVEFLNRFIVPNVEHMLVGKNGMTAAYIQVIPNKDGSQSKTMWSCHTDTVHSDKGLSRQFVRHDVTGDLHKDDGEPLGADDGAGCWLLLQMMAAGVPGTYVFHRGEEKGGIGSSIIAAEYVEWLGQFNHAIAFDRRGTSSVITHQAGGRCCSDAFADQMSLLLTDEDDTYIIAPDDGGTFTDTAKYTKIIPECTNISIGYEHEHSGSETLDVTYLLWLKDRMISVFGSDTPPTLVAERDPKEVEYLPRYNSWNYGFDWDQKGGCSLGKWDDAPASAEEVVEMRWRELVRWVETASPDEVAALLLEMSEQIVYDAKGEVK